jgi:hypothetical protein
MTFSSLNYLAILIAAVAGFAVGAAWYTMLAKPWMAANGFTPESVAAARLRPGGRLPFFFAACANVVMAAMLAGIMFHVGPLTIRNGLISGGLIWLGFVFTAMLVNNAFARRDPHLLWLDGGHWLAVLLVEGAILGAMGGS